MISSTESPAHTGTAALTAFLPQRFPRALKGARFVRIVTDTAGRDALEVAYSDGRREHTYFKNPQELFETLQAKEIARRPREAWEFHH